MSKYSNSTVEYINYNSSVLVSGGHLSWVSVFFKQNTKKKLNREHIQSQVLKAIYCTSSRLRLFCTIRTLTPSPFFVLFHIAVDDTFPLICGIVTRPQQRAAKQTRRMHAVHLGSIGVDLLPQETDSKMAGGLEVVGCCRVENITALRVLKIDVVSFWYVTLPGPGPD